MKPLKLILLFALTVATPAPAQQPEGDLAKIKEQELEDVRQRISALKKNIDDRVATRDQLTAELQEAEIAIAGNRIRLKELERERDYSAKRKAELEAKLATREAELDEESTELAEQVRAA